MAAAGAPRRLHVAAADAIAKSRRAADAASVRTVTIAASSTPPPSTTTTRRRAAATTTAAAAVAATVEDDFYEADDGRQQQQHHQRRRFSTAPRDPVAESPPFAAALRALFTAEANHGRGVVGGGRNGYGHAGLAGGGEAPRTSPLTVALGKALPSIEKAAGVVSMLPDPTLLMLTLVLALLVAHQARPQLLADWPEKLAILLLFVGGILPVSVLWHKTDMLAALREGQNPLVHPAEDAMEDLEADLKRREVQLAAASAALAKSRQQLDALKKELFKDPAACEPDAVIIPNKKAAAMIAAGALGTALDRETTEAVEARRKQEAKLRSQLEWKRKTEATEGEAAETKESLQRLVNHAAALYTARTRELRNKSGAAPNMPFGAAQFNALRSGINKAAAATAQAGGLGGGGQGDSGSLKSGSSRGEVPDSDETRSLERGSADAARGSRSKRRSRIGRRIGGGGRGASGDGGNRQVSASYPETPEAPSGRVPSVDSAPVEKPKRTLFRRKQRRDDGGNWEATGVRDGRVPSSRHSSQVPSVAGSL